MKLDVGNYKFKKGHGIFSNYHYLRIFIENRKYYYQVDHSLPQLMDDQDQVQFHMDDVRILKKISRPPDYKNIKVCVEFEDDDGHPFKMTARSIHVLKRIFELFPRLKKIFFQ